jgi:integrase
LGHKYIEVTYDLGAKRFSEVKRIVHIVFGVASLIGGASLNVRNGSPLNFATGKHTTGPRMMVASIGLDPKLFGTHSLRRTKATLIYRRTGNLRAVQLLLGHTKIESTVRYLGIEMDDALAIAEQVEV